MKIDPTETAFFAYLLDLDIDKRAKHLADCFLEGGKLYEELSEAFGEVNPEKLAHCLEDYKEQMAEKKAEYIYRILEEEKMKGRE